MLKVILNVMPPGRNIIYINTPNDEHYDILCLKVDINREILQDPTCKNCVVSSISLLGEYLDDEKKIKDLELESYCYFDVFIKKIVGNVYSDSSTHLIVDAIKTMYISIEALPWPFDKMLFSFMYNEDFVLKILNDIKYDVPPPLLAKFLNFASFTAMIKDNSYAKYINLYPGFYECMILVINAMKDISGSIKLFVNVPRILSNPLHIQTIEMGSKVTHQYLSYILNSMDAVKNDEKFSQVFENNRNKVNQLVELGASRTNAIHTLISTNYNLERARSILFPLNGETRINPPPQGGSEDLMEDEAD
ncbi:hypothetical protein A3Q56_06083 [Intoshia linei]|uniref:UBA domain-containing protein n=1 Tax=Intoshia linei TaxID=1819745 RepID=A0A177AXG5_9BILA|nr:hypothetical protein A3Q56_06083 [Intoshia linei]